VEFRRRRWRRNVTDFTVSVTATTETGQVVRFNTGESRFEWSDESGRIIAGRRVEH